ncbi:unnamed protein product [Heterosigma akashiwo]
MLAIFLCIICFFLGGVSGHDGAWTPLPKQTSSDQFLSSKTPKMIDDVVQLVRRPKLSSLESGSHKEAINAVKVRGQVKGKKLLQLSTASQFRLLEDVVHLVKRPRMANGENRQCCQAMHSITAVRGGAEDADQVEEKGPRVMFVCRMNSCRSQMAEGYAHALGRGKIQAFSAGVVDSSRVHPKGIEFMAEAGIDITGQTSNALSEYDPAGFDKVISMCGCGVSIPDEWKDGKHFEDWNLPDPDGLPDEEWPPIRDEIARRVAALVAELAPEDEEREL